MTKYRSSPAAPRSILPVLVSLLLFMALPACAQRAAAPDSRAGESASAEPVQQGFPIFAEERIATILVDPGEDEGILRAVRNLQADLEARTGARPLIATSLPNETEHLIIVGSLGKSRWLAPLTEQAAVSSEGLAGEWEAFMHEAVERPFDGVESALIVAGSDKRGTIYGVYDLAEQAGISPWTWWADVPIEQTDTLFVPGERRVEKPAVRYRGIFLNDENPALYGWVNATYGGFNHDFYERVFELILRLKGNYLWPAMWGKAFYDDDPMNAALADEMGVVIGTSHHEPLGRAHIEWERYGEGAWNFASNPAVLTDFWRFGMERIAGREAIVTIGMRGDGDEAMTEGTAPELLEGIVAAQRDIIAEVTGAPASEQPQIWALYKEVQDYYDQGMSVPDDVTLLFADDNWGNIRRLPKLGEERPGGYGVYYHFDYVGGPRNYKWINTTQLERVREQMSVAYEYGADELWIVNVGDLKPMELPIDFFLDFAWDPSDWPLERMGDYTRQWAGEQFPDEHADEIADLLDTYTKFNARRKPELLDPDTYSLVN
ncbi:MAG: glycosyl hydrolase 115 family protein, partial [Henriciella sp.]|uniref:glycosyl hydrolase 115 family protein n=1 Tax=Henriciella sp. TaxID=1968823 RepID=UPI003C7605BC